MTDGKRTSSASESKAFRARPKWQRVPLRWWRVGVYCRLPGCDRHGIPRKAYRYIQPPREVSQENMDAAIRRGRELAKEYGW